MAALLDVRGLRTEFADRRSPGSLLQDVNFSVGEGEILGIVGESGSGKTMTALSVTRLLPPALRVAGGEVVLRGRDLLALGAREMNRVRGEQVSMVFQNPRGSLNPLFRVGRTLEQVLRVHRGLRGEGARRASAALLADVGLPDPERVLTRYPHQLSGGMCQRVMIALALASEPQLLIADEPTTALDVTIQLQIIVLLARLREEHGLAQIVITHNLGVVAELCDRVVVMYAGRIVEEGPVRTIFEQPRHPYTRALLASRPRVELNGGLVSIPGNVPDLREPPPGCPFNPRCTYAQDICSQKRPPLEPVADRHGVACHFAKELA